jgi:hypothetical protein
LLLNRAQVLKRRERELKSRDKTHKVETIISREVITRVKETVHKVRAKVKVETVIRVRADKAVTVLETITRVADKETVLKVRADKVETVLETIIKVVKTVLKDKEVRAETEVDSIEADKAETDRVKEQCLLN